MKSLLLLTLLAFLGCLLAARALRRGGVRSRADGWPFAQRVLLTSAEQVLYHRLVDALPERVVLAQVPLAAFLRVRKGENWRAWHNRIARKSVDFLVCERDFSIVMAIELDDASHDRPAAPARDLVKSRALTAAGVTLVRCRTTDLPDIATIRAIVDDLRDGGFDGRDVVTAARIESRMHVSVVDASNDPSIYQEETRS